MLRAAETQKENAVKIVTQHMAAGIVREAKAL